MKVRGAHTRSAGAYFVSELVGPDGWRPSTAWEGLPAGCLRLPTAVDLAHEGSGSLPSARWFDEPRLDGETTMLTGARIALLPAVLAAWQERAKDVSRTLVLVHTDHESHGQDTVFVQQLCAAWAAAHVYGLEVRPVVGLSAPFRFGTDATELRSRLARLLDDDMAGESTVFLSASTGTIPTMWSLAAATRARQPTLLHVPLARSVLPATREYKVEAHVHEASDRPTAVDVSELEPAHRALVAQLSAWRDEYEPVWAAHKPARQQDGGPLHSFWLRKGHKPVLSVLAVRRPDGELAFHRGCNLEVSLPTGTLCAERNAIGSALAGNPALDRRDFVAIAVLGLEHDGPLGPCGVCNEWLLKVSEQNPAFRVLTFADRSLTQVLCEPVD